jgi:hypothetical protein
MPRVCALAVVCVAVVGCGDSMKVAPVSGRVTLDDKPLAGASVSFIPASEPKKKAPPVAVATTDADGHYTLVIPGDRERTGAIVGKHKVTITLATDLEAPKESGHKDKAGHKDSGSAVTHIPERYNSKTELTFEVPEKGTTEANFDLKSKESAPAKGPADTKVLPKTKTKL